MKGVIKKGQLHRSGVSFENRQDLYQEDGRFLRVGLSKRSTVHVMTDVTIRLFSTDLDGTLLGKDEARELFNTTWANLDEQNRPCLCYNTGRMHENVLELVDQNVLPAPDFIISGVGTSVYDYKAGQVLKEFSEMLDDGWDIEKVIHEISTFPADIKKQAPHYQNEYKSSWYFPDASSLDIDGLKAQLEQADLDVHVVYSSGLHLDVLPRWANKGPGPFRDEGCPSRAKRFKKPSRGAPNVAHNA